MKRTDPSARTTPPRTSIKRCCLTNMWRPRCRPPIENGVRAPRDCANPSNRSRSRPREDWESKCAPGPRHKQTKLCCDEPPLPSREGSGRAKVTGINKTTSHPTMAGDHDRRGKQKEAVSSRSQQAVGDERKEREVDPDRLRNKRRRLLERAFEDPRLARQALHELMNDQPTHSKQRCDKKPPCVEPLTERVHGHSVVLSDGIVRQEGGFSSGLEFMFGQGYEAGPKRASGT